MRNNHEQKVESACAAVAAAITRLINAVIDGSTKKDQDASWQNGVGGAPVSDRLVRSTPPRRSGSLEENRPSASSRRLYIYLAGCKGLKTLVNQYGSKVTASLRLEGTPYFVKCGVTTIGLEERLRQIGADQYGAATRTDKGVEVDPGFSGWIAHAITTSRQPIDPDITLLPRAIAVDVPAAMTQRAFDAALHRALKNRALDRLPANVMPKRFVAYDLVKTRIGTAKELYALCPHDQAEGDMLLDGIEGILRQFHSRRR